MAVYSSANGLWKWNSMEAYNLFPSFEEENNNKKKRNFEGQELLIGLSLKGISFFGCYSSPLFLFLVKYQREFSSSGWGSCQEIVGGQGVQLYRSMIGDNSLDYVGKTKKKKKSWRWWRRSPTPLEWVPSLFSSLVRRFHGSFFSVYFFLFFTTFRSSTSFFFTNLFTSVSVRHGGHPQHNFLPHHSSSLGWPNAKER